MGCGKKVITKSGICRDCRKFTCTHCKKEFSWVTHPRSTCQPCKAKQKTITNFGGDYEVRAPIETEKNGFKNDDVRDC